MLSLIAQIPPPPEGIEAWLRNLFWLVGGLTACVVLYKQLTGGGDKAIKEVHGRIKREREEIETRFAKLEEEDLRLRAKLDEEISNLQDRVDAVPERTLNLLRTTKGLI